jgi:DNA-binding Lrp family transcriptional regulator
MPPSFNNPDKGRLLRKEDKDARALVFMLERIKGKTLNQIAADYDCSQSTVRNYVDRARREGLIINQARDLIQSKLLPLTLAVYEAHLNEGNLEAAQDILYGLGVLQKNSTIKHESSPDETLDVFRDRLLNARDAAVTVIPSPPVATLPEAVLEAPGPLPVAFPQEPAIPDESILDPSGRRSRLSDHSDEDE